MMHSRAVTGGTQMTTPATSYPRRWLDASKRRSISWKILPSTAVRWSSSPLGLMGPLHRCCSTRLAGRDET
eukprot:8824542-Prorocentrum_lima.AAC.1